MASMQELVELDENGNVIGVLGTEAKLADVIDQGRLDGRTLVSKPELEGDLELMRLVDGDWGDATAEHRERVEAERAETAEREAIAAEERKKSEQLAELAAKGAARTTEEDGALLTLVAERLAAEPLGGAA